MADKGLGVTGLIPWSSTDDNVINPPTVVAFGATTTVATTESTGGTSVAAEYWDPVTSTWKSLPLGGTGTGDATKAETFGVVIHGADATVARPTGYAKVWWFGTVEPTNATANDRYTYEEAAV